MNKSQIFKKKKLKFWDEAKINEFMRKKIWYKDEVKIKDKKIIILSQNCKIKGWNSDVRS